VSARADGRSESAAVRLAGFAPLVRLFMTSTFIAPIAEKTRSDGPV
jgi:hypothetical protein